MLAAVILGLEDLRPNLSRDSNMKTFILISHIIIEAALACI